MSDALTPEAAAGELRLRIGDFEGPLDLLLHLCRTNEIDLAALPVRSITDQYLAHLEAMEFRDLEVAGAYLVMAATLIYLKSKLLVPPDPNAEEDLDEEALALKQELEERLREYARVKTQGVWLAQREAEQALIWGRLSATLPPAEDVPLEDLSVHWLERSMKRLIEEQQRARPRQVEPNPPSVLERMTEILTLLRDTWSLLFSSMAGGERRRSDIVVSLLAVLELCRQGKIRTQQTDLFGDIVIERRSESEQTPAAIEQPESTATEPDKATATPAIEPAEAPGSESWDSRTANQPTAPAGGI
jgi:segregation and condensation protein A